MPLYDYLCKTCGAITEVRHAAGEKFAGACASCGNTALQRVFNPAPIHFKGSGFYATDSKKKSEPVKTKAESGTGEAKPSETGASAEKGSGGEAGGHPERSEPSRAAGETAAKPKDESAA